MKLFFGGGEINTHRDLLVEEGVRNIAMSYVGLGRRGKFVKKPWRVTERFPSYVSVFLDSGAYTLNKATDTHTPDEIEEIWDHYQDFVNLNLDHLNLVSEFDVLNMGLEWVEEQREVFWDKIPKEKFLAVWHPVWGLPYLNEMASRYEVIGIPETSMEGRNLRPTLNALAAKGIRLHSVGSTKIEEMQNINWDSVASTSWTSPQRYGDTIVWTGNTLKRYPMKEKAVARKRHRTLFTDMGLNAEAIANDDPVEVLRLSIRSWQSFEESINRRHVSDRGATPLFSHGKPPEVSSDDEVVDTQPKTSGELVPTTKTSTEVVNPRTVTTPLPVVGFTEPDEENPDPLITIRSESKRQCTTCFLANKCPAYEPGSNCAYNIPIQMRTRAQRKALHEGMIELQTQRVLFMKFAEDIEGGYADPNLTKELNVLNKMLADYAELEREGFSITMTARGSADQLAGAGRISRLFGSDVGQAAGELESGPVSADSYIEAEIVGEGD